MKSLLKKLAKDKRGAVVVEYALVVALVAIVAVAALANVGENTAERLQELADALG